MSKASDRIPPHLILQMQVAIEEADGAERLFVGSLDEEGRLAGFRVVAQGNDEMVGAPWPHMSQGDVVIHNHPSGNLKPSNADVEVAARLSQEGIGSWIVDNRVTKLAVIAESYVPGKVNPLDVAELADMLLPGGALSRINPDFEPRDPQLEMLEEVVEGFNHDRVVVVEAGTGVGKSLAYLIPAFSWVIRNRERVVISTATINLQQQILSKDIPTVQKLFSKLGGRDIRVVIAKGRNQYLCQNRLADVLEEEGMFAEEQLDLICQWAESSPTGDRSDLSFVPDEALWSRINSDPDACSENRCRVRAACFLQKARKEMATAHIIVTNHHLLFADLAIRNQGFGTDATVILPAFQRLIIDEAHNVESAATSYFSEEINRFQIHKYANMLLRSRRGRAAGIVPALREQAGAGFEGLEGLLQNMRTAAQTLDDELLPLFEYQQSYRLMSSLSPAALEAAGAERTARGSAADGRRMRGMDPGSGSEPDISNHIEAQLFPVLAGLQQAILDCVEALAGEHARLEESESEDPRIQELRIIIRRLEGAAKICSEFRDYHQRPDLVYWLDRRRTGSGDRFVHLTATPIEVGPLLEEALFEPYQSIILTSATLSVNKSIQFWQRRVGLGNSDRLNFRSLDSPFDYENRVLLGIPSDAPDPGEGQRYSEWLKGFISKTLEISEGHALVLFTSYAMLEDVYQYCKPLLTSAGISCLRQGDDDRNRLMIRFRDDSSSVLFATHSFWEGVDAPGDALKLLIICRLPFRVPTEPVLLARTEAVERRGGNAFAELSLPEAVMKLKQGFGRLMRRTSDRGAVIITDRRIISKSYGRVFIASLPPARLVVDESTRLYNELERVLYEG